MYHTSYFPNTVYLRNYNVSSFLRVVKLRYKSSKFLKKLKWFFRNRRIKEGERLGDRLEKYQKEARSLNRIDEKLHFFSKKWDFWKACSRRCNALTQEWWQEIENKNKLNLNNKKVFLEKEKVCGKCVSFFVSFTKKQKKIKKYFFVKLRDFFQGDDLIVYMKIHVCISTFS